MKIVIIIWAIISVINLILQLAASIDVANRVKRIKPNPNGWFGKTIAFLKVIILCSLPLFHLILLFGNLFWYNAIVEKALDGMIASGDFELG